MTGKKITTFFSLAFALSLFVSIYTGCSDSGNDGASVTSVVVKLVSPSNDSVGVSGPVNFAWISNYSGSESGVYSLYFGRDEKNLEKIADDLTGIEYTYEDVTNSTRYFWKVELSVGGKVIASSKVGSFTTNNPPGTFALLSPADDSFVGVELVTLKWSEATDEDGGEVRYEVFVGEGPDSLVRMGTSYDPVFVLSDLASDRTYYWKVRAVDSSNGVTDSPVWKFHTVTSIPEPQLYSPIDYETDVPVSGRLVWNGVSSSSSNPVVYDVYLGIPGALIRVAEGISSTNYEFHGLAGNTTYVWKVVARDSAGNTGESESWSFTTCNETKAVDLIKSSDSSLFYIDSGGNLWGFGRNQEGELADGTTTNRFKPVLIENPYYERWVDVGTGTLHVCAIDEYGSMYCWGWDYYGQLGIGYKTDLAQTSLHEIEDPAGDKWVSVDGGKGHTCAVDSGGNLYCWGYNNNNQVGQEDTSVNFLYPVVVSGSGNRFWTKVDSGYYFACAMDNESKLWCWGDNPYGQLPTSDTHSFFPLEVTNGDGSPWASFSAGYDHACAIDYNGSLWCWGRNNYGQIGNGRGGDNSDVYSVSAVSPVKIYVPGNQALHWKTVSTNSYHTCAIDENDSLWCWGMGRYGALGRGSRYDSNVPVKVDELEASRWNAVASGGDYTCGVDGEGSLLCWGRNNYGQLGLGIESISKTDYPVLVKNRFQRPWKRVAIGGVNSYGLDVDGNWYGWGGNMFGSLGRYGDLLEYQYDYPITVYTDRKVSDLFPGIYYSCVKDMENSVWCIGYNGWKIDYYPTKVTNNSGSDWEKLSLGYYHTCGLDVDHEIWCWGNNRFGQLGDRSFDSGVYPRLVTNDSGISWSDVISGVYHSCGIDVNGQLWCWGYNYYYQLGVGSSENMNYPVLVTNAANSPWLKVSLGLGHSCGIDVDGNLWCWGENDSGQVGDHSVENRGYPVPVTNVLGTRWVSIALGYYHTCGIDTEGNLWCWGKNAFGQLGKGDYTNIDHPVMISNSLGTRWRSVSLGYGYSCGVDVNDHLWCWGRNTMGELGLGIYLRVYPSRVYGY